MPVNPYTPPVDDVVLPSPDGAADEVHAVPRAAIWVARGWLVLVLLGVVLGGLAAVAMRIELWSPEPTLEPESYARAFGLHGGAMLFLAVLPVIFGVLGNLVVPEAMRARRLPTVALAWIALATWTLGATTIAITAAAADTGHTFAAPGLPPWLSFAMVCIAASMVLGTVHLAVVVLAGLRRADPIARVVGLGVVLPMVGQLVVIGLGVVELVRAPFVYALEPVSSAIFSRMMDVAVIAGLAVAIHLANRGREPTPWRAWTAGAALLVVATWVFVTAHGAAVLGTSVAKLALVVVALRAAGKRGAEWVPVAFGVAPALFAWTFARTVHAHTDLESHLHDTWFVVGSFHFEAAIVGFVGLAGVLAWCEPLLGRTVATWPARAGALLVCGGTLAHAFAMLALGERGMPRRYSSYIPEFASLQRGASVAAWVVVVGALLLAIAFARGRRVRGSQAEAERAAAAVGR